MLNLVFTDDEIYKYLRQNNVIKKQTSIQNLANDIDSYVSHEINFRKLENLKPIEGINNINKQREKEEKENFSENKKNYIDTSIEREKMNKEKERENLGETLINYNNSKKEKESNKEEKSLKIKTEKSFKNLTTEKSTKNYKGDIHIIAEEGKSDFLLTGMKLDGKKTLYDEFNNFEDNNNLSEKNNSKYLPPLTKRSFNIKGKSLNFNITGNTNNNNNFRESGDLNSLRSPEKKESILNFFNL